MATSIATLLRSLQGLEVGPNEAPILVINDSGEWIGTFVSDTPVKTASAT